MFVCFAFFLFVCFLFGSLLVDCGVFLLCLHLRLFLRCGGLKQPALLSFKSKLLSKIHISQDALSFSVVRESIQLVTRNRRYNDFFFPQGSVDLST